MLVDRALIPDSMVIPRHFRLAADGRPHSDGCAVGQCLPGFPILQSTLQSDVCQLPRIPVIIGNVRGVGRCLADRCLADPDSKAEDQGGARARTSAGNNNDNKGKED